MSGALKNIIQRHLQAPNTVQPRLPGIFEQGVTETPDTSAFFSETTDTGAGYTAAPTPVFQPDRTRLRQETSGFRLETSASEPSTPDTFFAENISRKWSAIPVDSPEETRQQSRAGKPENPVEPAAAAFTLPAHAEKVAREPQHTPATDFHARIRYIKMISGHAGQNPLPAENGSLFPGIPRAFERIETWRQQPLSPAAREKTEAPAINIHIGSIEIRAVKTPPPARNTSAAPKPAMSLEQYINERKG
jgi:hypothetical protein